MLIAEVIETKNSSMQDNWNQSRFCNCRLADTQLNLKMFYAEDHKRMLVCSIQNAIL